MIGLKFEPKAGRQTKKLTEFSTVTSFVFVFLKKDVLNIID